MSVSNDLRPIEQRIETIIDQSMAASRLVRGREVYVPLSDLYDVVGTIHGLRYTASRALRDAEEADAKVCPLALGDPHSACVRSVESEKRASDLQADHDKAVLRLGKLESALVEIMLIEPDDDGFNPHTMQRIARAAI
ncbi:hypothetical protein [Brevundimonas sp. KM4]|uniref:hypothetical protein n=1 Tax=Brevundimonas sp. KM4 TaxID=1628191 RepID=UPI000A65B534|nr:hypothetical protein [Brevundimonas sp. KM4]